MKKRLALFVGLLISVLLLSACGKMSDEKAIAAMKESDELWINHGLAAWEAGSLMFCFQGVHSLKQLQLQRDLLLLL